MNLSNNYHPDDTTFNSDSFTDEFYANKYNVSSADSSYVRDETFEYVTEGVLLTSISVLGLIGNVLAIYVLLRPSVRGVFSNILTSLASFDALFLATAPFTFGLPILSPYLRVSNITT